MTSECTGGGSAPALLRGSTPLGELFREAVGALTRDPTLPSLVPDATPCWMIMLGRGPWKFSAVIIGLFGQVAFFADFGRDLVPAWLRVAAHLALVMPL